jgi:hypothetical protein
VPENEGFQVTSPVDEFIEPAETGDSVQLKPL